MKRGLYILLLAVSILAGWICAYYSFPILRSYIIKQSKKRCSYHDTQLLVLNENDNLKYDVLLYGDTVSYNLLVSHERQKNSYDYFYYSVIMANKYKYDKAIYDIVGCLEEVFHNNRALGNMDEKTEQLYLYYKKRLQSLR